jgi:nitric oxide reductase subunit B
MLMVLLDLFPAGSIQLCSVLEHGLWFARSQQFILSTPFQTLTWMRIVGGSIFVLLGVLPLAGFVLSNHKSKSKVAMPQVETVSVS